jgi:lipopolysaccharide heptosyltransferase II
MSIPFSHPPRILVTRTDRIGDLVLSTPVFGQLRKKFPDAWIAGLTFPENRGVIEGNPFLDECLFYDKSGSERGGWATLQFSRKLRQKKFDVILHLHATNRMHLVGWLAGIPVRIGWRRKCAWALTHSREDIKKEGKKHEAEYNFDLLEFLGVEPPDFPEVFFPLPPKAEMSLAELLRHHGIPDTGGPRVILNPSASCPSKRWPAERFADLAALLRETYGAVLMMIGSRRDRCFNERVAGLCRVPLYDFSGRLSLPMLGWLLKKSALLISNDSGPVHIASAVGTPVISIFGRKQSGLSPVRWRPLGKKSQVVWKDIGCVVCLAHRCQINFLCLEAVSAEEVFGVAGRFLTAGGGVPVSNDGGLR